MSPLERLEDAIDGREWYIAGFIVLVALVLRFRYAFMSGMWVDEGRHALVATALLEHPLQYSSPYHGVITNLPPVYPYLLFIAQAILGYGKTAVYSVSPVMGAVGVLATYVLGRELFDDAVGLIAAALLAVSPVYFFLSERILIGVTLTVLYVASVYLVYYGLQDRRYSRYALWLSGPVTALALLTKQPAYLLGPILGIYLVWTEGITFLTDPREYRDLYIAAVLGALTLAPWLLRNVGVCGQLFCSSSKALSHILESNPPDWANTGGPFYYFTILPSLLTLPIAAVLYLRYGLIEPYISLTRREARRVGLAAGAVAVLGLAAFVVKPAFIPMILLLGLTYLQDSDEDRLLWLWIAFGIGFMSLTAIKVPRYVVFVVPALLILSGKAMVDAKDWLTGRIDVDGRTAVAVLAIAVVALSIFSGLNATSRVVAGSSGFQQLEPAGKWFRDTNVSVLSTSPRQEMFYSRNSADFDIVPTNNTRLDAMLRSGQYEYLVIDVYERTRTGQVQYVQQEYLQGNSSLLRPVRAFRQQGRPVVIILEVNGG